mgnify:CR=1 FL=1
MIVGILKEPEIDNRVALLPENVKTLIDLRTSVIIEKGAGDRSFYSDNEYKEVGAHIVERSKLISDADLLVSINALSSDEYKKLNIHQAVLTAYGPLFNKDLLNQFVSD